ncbi:PREDICTED: limulus clotting factor C-like isoform X2 [Vollenhovia emeryi]|uniref:limulus clotting factor C-like isoform X2 n=1 Tax=Vollenhovia emeryi TaxID=411798 RepID=UPI0005F4C338|nr:PREDICTED: limulus clotting factor C-like isoform X2 [Vollenhovia emeryi]
MPVTNARVAFSVALSLLALLPSLSLQDRSRTSDGFPGQYETIVSDPPGRSKWNENNDFSGPSINNKWEDGGRGPAGGSGTSRLTGGSSSGLNDNRPPSWNKVGTESSSDNYPRNYPNNDGTTRRSSESRTTQRSPDYPKTIQRQPDYSRTTQRSLDYPNTQRQSDYSRTTQRSLDHPNTQRQSDYSRTTQRSLDHPNTQRQSDYSRTTQRSLDHPNSSQRQPDYSRTTQRHSDYDREGPDDRVSDDRDEYPQGRQCRNDEFRCGSNECLPRSVKCDNRIDCRDSSDEELCVTNRNQEDSCVLPEQQEGGHYVLSACGERCDRLNPGDVVPKNSILNFTCKSNYVLKGNSISVCADNKWYQAPTCQKVCPPLNSTSVDISCRFQGEVVSCSERIMPGTRATLACKSSYKLPLTNDPAYREITCLDDGLWDRRLFRCLPECGTSVARGNTLIVNGFQAKTGVFPWHVGIYTKGRKDDYRQICGGTLITNNLVVSAAHCFYDETENALYGASKYAVAIGKHYRDWYTSEEYAQQSLLESIQAGGRYQGARGNFADDIALLKLKTPFELTALVKPVCVDWDNTYEREQLQVGHAGKVVGWGRDIKGESAKSLQEIDMPFVPYDQCLSAVPADFRGFLTSDKFCAGHLNGSSVCDGDSGGGLCFEKDGIWYLRGIVSVSPENKGSCDYNSYVGFTSVSHFRDWIREAYVQS